MSEETKEQSLKREFLTECIKSAKFFIELDRKRYEKTLSENTELIKQLEEKLRNL